MTQPTAEYESVFDMRELVETVYVCYGWEIRETSGLQIEGADCDSDTIFFRYVNAGSEELDRNGRTMVLHDLLDKTTVDLVGPNWAVHCGSNEDTCALLRPILGGELIIAEPPAK